MTVEEIEDADICVFCVMPCSVPKEEMGRWCSLLGKARSEVQTSTPRGLCAIAPHSIKALRSLVASLSVDEHHAYRSMRCRCMVKIPPVESYKKGNGCIKNVRHS